MSARIIDCDFDFELEDFEKRYPTLAQPNGGDMDTMCEAIICAGFRKAKYELRPIIETLLNKKKNFSVNDLSQVCHWLHSNRKNNVSLRERKGVDAIVKKNSLSQVHTYDEAEIVGFSDWLTKVFTKISICKVYLPVTKDNLFESLNDGFLLCHTVNIAVPNTIDERLINKGENMSLYKKYENCSLAIKSAEAIGCCVVNIGAEDIINQNSIITLGLVWQLIKKMLLSKINLIDHPNLFLLIKDTEMTLQDLARMSPERLLILWVNYQLSRSKCHRRLNIYPNDIKDGEIYSHLIHQIAPKDPKNKFVNRYGQVNLANIKSSNWTENAENVLKEAGKIEANVFVKAGDITSGATKLNYAFLAYLFNKFPNLENQDQKVPVIEENREEKGIRNWMNSFDLNINYLYFDLRDGLALLSILNKIKPGSVNWKKGTKIFDENKIVFQQIENCNYAVELAHSSFNLSIVNISGLDINSGSQRLTLALAWQIMNYHLLEILGNVSDGNRRPSESEILLLVNKKLNSKLQSFRSNEFRNSKPLFKLFRAVRGDIAGLNLYEDFDSAESRMKNAMLILSLIRQCGGRAFVLPEDIVECKSKQMMLVCASIISLKPQ